MKIKFRNISGVWLKTKCFVIEYNLVIDAKIGKWNKADPLDISDDP